MRNYMRENARVRGREGGERVCEGESMEYGMGEGGSVSAGEGEERERDKERDRERERERERKRELTSKKLRTANVLISGLPPHETNLLTR